MLDATAHLASHLAVLYFLLYFVEILRYALPYPHEIPLALFDQDFEHGVYWLWILEHVGVTLFDAGSGFLLGNGVAIVLAIAIVLTPRLEKVVMPDVIALKSIPWVVLIPIFMITPFLGPTWRTRTAIVALGNFFPTLINVHTGLKEVPDDVYDYSSTLPGMTRWILLRHVRIFYAVPFIFASLKVGAGNVITSAVVVEWLVAGSGLGWLLFVFQFRYRMDLLWGLAITTGLLGYGFLWLVRRAEDGFSSRLRGFEERRNDEI